ncbi:MULTISPECIES: hypothetical protein [unclassified Luteococcus]|uniref:hypothetical protein n=1 Tax=unclassified Luteococcus TaxID=2639923 RepID=UPI00313C0060
MSDQWIISALSTVIVGLMTLMGVRYTARTGAKTTKESIGQKALQDTLDQLQEEVGNYRMEVAALREHVAALDTKLDVTTKLARKAVNFIDRVALAVSYGRPLPRPDGVLAEAVDMSLWPTDNP